MSATHLVYMDHAATTPLCDEARLAMEPFLGTAGPGDTAPDRFGVAPFGNPSGSHAVARAATRALDEAREKVAEAVGCAPGEVVFTSGGTESDNLAITGGMPPRAGVPVCSAVEHPAVLEPVRVLGGELVAVDTSGRIDLDALAGCLQRIDERGVSVVSVMAANNELGTLNDLDAVARVVRSGAPGVPLHTDAVQAAAWCDLRELAAAADLVSVSAHKLGGPKGVGALVVRTGTPLRPLLHGGGQERGRRGGTHDVAGIVGFAAALATTCAQRRESESRVSALRDELARGLTGLEGVRRSVPSGTPTLPGHLHLMVDGVGSEELLLLLEQRGVCASAASSCASGASSASHVLVAAGIDRPGSAPLRLTLGSSSTPRDVETTVAALGWALDRARSRSGDLAAQGPLSGVPAGQAPR